jgi:hypothetical protein
LTGWIPMKRTHMWEMFPEENEPANFLRNSCTSNGASMWMPLSSLGWVPRCTF